ncbi:glutaredoxin 3 [Parachitinimonas caeni]|uniref:Glutaredoxin n=1 Tax=Parachitinimonas caeni TaxID=3031301 RepID=A0ABT7E3Z3_9NEIS|nr:glutaredoxin 3 [Parachitinimonas caeni]MDK2126053.1 glutaredoxin 3 [Parachitinimonas caeni]
MSEVTMFHTSTCPYCVQAESLLKRKGVTHINKVNVGTSAESRAEMIAKTGRRTVPQIFIGERHIGGFDDLAALELSGGLTPLLLA